MGRSGWGIALWVENTHGENGWFHIAQEQDRLLAAGDSAGVTLWRAVGERYEEFIARVGESPS